MKRKKKRGGGLKINTSPAIKMSEIMGEFAGDYISMGETTEERQNYLNGACTAWNVAVLPEHKRGAAMEKIIKEYNRINAGNDDLEFFLENLRKLIARKLEMFPDVNKVIINASIEPIDSTRYRILVLSTENPR